MKPPRRTAGFTLLELLVVLTIISILAALLMPSINTSMESARRMACANNMKEIYFALHMFSAENDGRFPDGHPNNYWGDPDLDTRRAIDANELSNRAVTPPTSFEGDADDYPKNLIRNNYIFDASQVYPDYLGNMAVLTCPSSLTTRDLPRDRYFMDETFSEEHIDPDLYDYQQNEIPISRLQGLRPDTECVTSEFYTFLPYALETEENALFLWDIIAYRMFWGDTDFMNARIMLDPDSFESRNSRRDIVGDDPTDRFGNRSTDRASNRPGDRFGDNIEAEYDSRYGHAPGGGDTWYQTAIGIGKIFIRSIDDPGTDYVDDSKIPVLFDTVSQNGLVQMNHLPVGGNVLYLDGHVEFQKYSTTKSPREGFTGNWNFFSFSSLPYTTDFIEFLRANVYDNTTLMNIPPWCSNRPATTPFEPRYWYYPYDEMYEDLTIDDDNFNPFWVDQEELSPNEP